MMRLRSILPLFLALAPLTLLTNGGCSGCTKEEVPTPAPETSAATATASAKGKLPLRGAISPIPKIDPLDRKLYQVDVCYFGTLSLRQARDAYLGSLGKDEPSEKKIPSLGFGAQGAVRRPEAPNVNLGPSGVQTPKPLPAPSAAAAPAPSSSGVAVRKPIDLTPRPPHERNARSCTATGLKEPAIPEVDAALAAFGNYALELSRNIASASIYYQREEYKKDNFQKGKDLHKKLVDDFAKLDELSDKLGAALAAYRKEHPLDPAKSDEGERLTVAAYTEAQGVLTALLPKKVDAPGKLKEAIEALRAFGAKNAGDPWAKITAPKLDAFLKLAEEAKVDEKGVAPDAFLSMINSFVSLISAKHTALSQSLVAKGQTVEPRGANNLPVRPLPVAKPPEGHVEEHKE
jgi:uncharacterized protein DUF3829